MKKFRINKLVYGCGHLTYQSDNWCDIVNFLKNANLNSYEICERIGKHDKKVIYLVYNKEVLFKDYRMNQLMFDL